MKTILPRFFPRLAALLAPVVLTVAPSPVVAEDAAAPAPAETAPTAAPEPVIDAATVIARARAFLGGEDVLNSIRSLHFKGTVSSGDGTSRKIEVLMARPMKQRMTQFADDRTEVTVLNGYEAWSEVTSLDARRARTVNILGPNEIRVLRMRTWQTLYYYHDLDAVGGEVRVEGEEVVDGATCIKLLFIHGPRMGYVRYFDKETGRLVVTKSTSGGELRESGELFVAGIRFPKEVTETANDLSSTFVIDEVKVNETFPEELFEFPMLRFRRESAAPATAPAEPSTPAPSRSTPPATPPAPPAATAPTP